MAKTYKTYLPEQDLLLPPSLREWLPENHLAYCVSDVVDQLDLSAIESVYEEEDRGQPPYSMAHPCGGQTDFDARNKEGLSLNPAGSTLLLKTKDEKLTFHRMRRLYAEKVVIQKNAASIAVGLAEAQQQHDCRRRQNSIAGRQRHQDCCGARPARSNYG
jgi:hypothetical protein